MKTLTKFQQKILCKLKSGLHINCTEGKNYKVWFILPNGEREFVRRDSVNQVINANMDNLTFGETIFWNRITT